MSDQNTIEQRSEAWHQLRLGRVTGSMVKNVLMSPATAGYKNYRAQLVLERLNGEATETYQSKEMQHGIETEPVARLQYMLKTRANVTEEAFIPHPTLMAGISPDGLVGDDGLIEIKCRNTANALYTLHTKQIPPEYKAQVQMQLWVTGRLWCDYVSFDNRLPKNAQLCIVHVERDEEYIKKLEQAVIKFLDEVAAEVDFISNYGKVESNVHKSDTVSEDSNVPVQKKKDGVSKAPHRKAAQV